MKNLMMIMVMLCLFSCSNNNTKESAVAQDSTVVQEKSIQKAETTPVFAAEQDTLSHNDREHSMNTSSFAVSRWRDTVCGQCSRRCCVSCTAGGNPAQCAETRFRECNSCGHASASHYSGIQ